MIMRDVARQTISEMRDGICWLALWKENKTWEFRVFWPMNVEDGEPIFEAEDMAGLKEIYGADNRAILVNSYYCNIGEFEHMTIRSLQDGLAWNYNERHNILSRFL